MRGVISFEESIDKKRNNYDRAVPSVSSKVKQPSVPETVTEKTPDKEEVLPDKVEEEVLPIVTETQQEAFTETKVFEPDLKLATGEAKGESIEEILVPPRSLSQEVEKDNSKEVVSIFQSYEAPDQTKIVAGKVSLISYPFEFDKVSLVSKQSQWHHSRFEDGLTFMSSVRQVDNPSVLKKRVFREWSEEAFK